MSRFRNLLFYLLICVTPLIFFTDTTRNPYYIQGVLVYTIICSLWISKLVDVYRSNKMEFRPTPLDWPLIVFLLIASLSLLRSFWLYPQYSSAVGSEGSKNLLFLFLNVFLVFYSVIYFVENIFMVNRLVEISLLVGLISSIYGVLQFYGIELVWSKTLTPFGSRCVSTFGNPNFYSSFLVSIMPLNLGKFLSAQKFYRKLYYLFFLFFSFWGLLCTLTRSSWAGVAVSFFLMGVICFFYWRDVFTQNKKWLAFIGLGAVLFIVFFPNSAQNSYSLVNRITEVSEIKGKVYAPWHQRVLIWSCAWKLARQRPVLGNGWGVFEMLYPFEQGKQLFQEKFRSLRTHANNAHNEILELWSQIGVLGLGVYVWVFYVFFFYGWKLLKKMPRSGDRMLAISLLAATAGMFVDNLLNVSLHFTIPAMFFYLQAGYLVKIGQTFAGQNSRSWEINKKYKFVPLLFSGFFLFLIGLSWQYFFAEVHYFRGFKNAKANRLEQARTELERAHRLHRYEVNNNYELGNIYARLNRYDQAIGAYQEAIGANPGYDEIYFNLAAVLNKEKKTKQAMENYRQSLLINPLSLETYLGLGNIYVGNNEYTSDGIKLYRAAVRIFPENKDLWNNLGYLYTRQENFNQAIECYQQALVLDPQFELAGQNLGFVRQTLQKINNGK
ncbi:MAG: tetratricopeptide repeat protein [Elusimicrobiota bacterium]